MHNSVPNKLRVLKSGNHGKNPLLLAEFQIGLKADYVIHGSGGIFLAKLNVRPRAAACVGVDKPHRAQRSVAQGIPSAPRHNLNGHTALVNLGVGDIEVVQGSALRRNKRVIKGVVLVPLHGAVYIVRLAPVVPRAHKNPVHIHGIRGDNGRNGVEERKSSAEFLPQAFRKSVGGKRTRCNYHNSIGGKLRHLAGDNFNVRVGLNLLRNIFGEQLPVHRKRASGSNRGFFRRLHGHGAEAAHFFFQQTGGGFKPHCFQ